MDKKPTKKQAALLDYIEKFSNENNVSPTYREIAAALKLSSVSAVAEHINNCVKAGFLEKVPKEARSLRVVKFDKHEETIQLFNRAITKLKERSETADDLQKPQIKDDIMTLEAAAKILGLDLM